VVSRKVLDFLLVDLDLDEFFLELLDYVQVVLLLLARLDEFLLQLSDLLLLPLQLSLADLQLDLQVALL